MLKLPAVVFARYPDSSVFTKTLKIFIAAPALARSLQEPHKRPMVVYQAAAQQKIRRRTEADLNDYQV